jgi:hypothetical protein
MFAAHNIRAVDEEGVISQGLTQADPSSDSELECGSPCLLTIFLGARQQLPMFVGVSPRMEVIRVFTEDGAVMVAVPDVGYAYNAFRG